MPSTRTLNGMGRLTTHVLDTAHGKPAANLEIRLFNANRELLKTIRTNTDGRADAPLLEGEDLKVGVYTLEFEVGAYFENSDFLGVVPVQFGISDAAAHCHVPLLVSPYGYSTYRGS
jgi:5-hydroxyisourate hydrolase